MTVQISNARRDFVKLQVQVAGGGVWKMVELVRFLPLQAGLEFLTVQTFDGRMTLCTSTIESQP